MQSQRIKEICKTLVSAFHLVVISGKVYDLTTNKRVSDDKLKSLVLNYFDDVDSRQVDAIIETLKLLECPNEEKHTIASANGLKLIPFEEYDQSTVERLRMTFGDDLEALIDWVHRLHKGNVPKQALNIWGDSNKGKTYFIDNCIGRMFNCCIGDWQGDWTIQNATDETQLIMFIDKDKGCIPSRKWEFLKQVQQGREVFVEVNPKCGAKYEIYAGLTSLIQTQLPARLLKPEMYYDIALRREWDAEDLAFKNRMLFIEFKIDNRDFKWDWNTIYSIFVQGGIDG